LPNCFRVYTTYAFLSAPFYYSWFGIALHVPMFAATLQNGFHTAEQNRRGKTTSNSFSGNPSPLNCFLIQALRVLSRLIATYVSAASTSVLKRSSIAMVCSSSKYVLHSWKRSIALCLRSGEVLARSWCIAVKSSVPQGMFVCFDKEVGWCVGIAMILVVGRER
jgi:hypothetical protein